MILAYVWAYFDYPQKNGLLTFSVDLSIISFFEYNINGQVHKNSLDKYYLIKLFVEVYEIKSLSNNIWISSNK